MPHGSYSQACGTLKSLDPATLPKVGCSALRFGAAFLEKYPTAPAACLEARDNHGQRYGKFAAKVYISEYLRLA